MEFWLINKIETFQFPVGFESFSINFSSMNKVINVLEFGELSLLGNNKLREWSVNGFFPAHDYSFLDCDRKTNPYNYCKIIDSLKYNKQVCRFIATNTRLNNACTIEDFEYSERDSSHDVYFYLSFREHKVLQKKLVVI